MVKVIVFCIALSVVVWAFLVDYNNFKKYGKRK